jgi:hypothetical protein
MFFIHRISRPPPDLPLVSDRLQNVQALGVVMSFLLCFTTGREKNNIGPPTSTKKPYHDVHYHPEHSQNTIMRILGVSTNRGTFGNMIRTMSPS